MEFFRFSGVEGVWFSERSSGSPTELWESQLSPPLWRPLGRQKTPPKFNMTKNDDLETVIHWLLSCFMRSAYHQFGNSWRVQEYLLYINLQPGSPLLCLCPPCRLHTSEPMTVGAMESTVTSVTQAVEVGLDGAVDDGLDNAMFLKQGIHPWYYITSYSKNSGTPSHHIRHDIPSHTKDS